MMGAYWPCMAQPVTSHLVLGLFGSEAGWGIVTCYGGNATNYITFPVKEVQLLSH